MKAVVVFRGDCDDHPLSWILKKGFRHCHVVVNNGESWIEIDGCMGVPLVKSIAPSDFDMATYYKNLGYTVVKTKQEKLKPAITYMSSRPFVAANCVGLVQLILGLNGIILTPYKLYKKLIRG